MSIDAATPDCDESEADNEREPSEDEEDAKFERVDAESAKRQEGDAKGDQSKRNVETEAPRGFVNLPSDGAFLNGFVSLHTSTF